MKKLLTPLILIVSTLFFVANADAFKGRYRDPVTNQIVEIDVSQDSTREEILKALADKREKSIEKSIKDKCIAKAGKMNNNFAAQKLYKSCLADEGL